MSETIADWKQIAWVCLAGGLVVGVLLGLLLL